MKFSSIIISALLSAGLPFSAHSSFWNKDFVTTRHHIRSASSASQAFKPFEVISSARRTSPAISTNWCGAVSKPPKNQKFRSVSALVTVPSVTKGAGAGPWGASAWVGIDGATNSKALFQAGFNLIVDKNGAQSFGAWYEWIPAAAVPINNFKISADDVISIKVSASSPTTGVVSLKNLRTGQSVTQTVKGAATATLTGQNAEWIVEDYTVGHGLVPLSYWKPVTFSECTATTYNNQHSGLQDITVYELEADRIVLTDVNIVDAGTMRVSLNKTAISEVAIQNSLKLARSL